MVFEAEVDVDGFAVGAKNRINFKFKSGFALIRDGVEIAESISYGSLGGRDSFIAFFGVGGWGWFGFADLVDELVDGTRF